MKRPLKPRPSQRDVQAAKTREHLLETAARFFESHPASELSLPKLARLAGVTPPTAYANFATVDELMGALYEWVLPRLGTRDPLPPPDRLHEVPLERFPRFAQYAGLLRSIWTSASWSQHRGRTRAKYTEAALGNLRSIAPRLSEREMLVALGPIIAFSYPPMWQWLRDIVGLSEEEAEQAAVWATRALVSALRTKPSSVGEKASPPARATRRRSTAKAR